MSKPTLETAPPATYNPLSKLAVLGLSCAGLYAIIVVMNTVVTAFLSGAPPFLPDVLLILPLAGAALSLLAIRQIRNSEGTLSGDRLAQWGLWLSVLTGLGYGAYFLTTGLAVQQQANAFLMVKGEETGFLEHLQDGDINQAFLLTLRWSQRKGILPNDPKQMAVWKQPRDSRDSRGPLDQFADKEIVQMIIQSGREKKPIQPLGVKSWKYEKGEYLVERNYRIETSEATVEIVVPVHSNDLDAPGEARKWNVVWTGIHEISPSKLTPLGQLRYPASLAFYYWLDKVKFGKVDPVCTNDQTDWDGPVVKTIGADLRKKVKKELDDFFSGKDPAKRFLEPDKKLIPATDKDGHIQFPFNLTIPVPFRPGVDEPRYLAEIQIVMQSKEPAAPAQPPPGLTWEPVSYKVVHFQEAPKKPKP